MQRPENLLKWRHLGCDMVDVAEWDEGIRRAYEHQRFPEAPPRYRGLAYPWRDRTEADNQQLWRNSVYYYWWEYMRRNERYRLVCDLMESAGDSELRRLHSDSITAEEIELYGHFGNVHVTGFHAWWQAHYRLFSDEVSVNVRVIDGGAADGPGQSDGRGEP
jgi:hypothetical protein